MTTTRVQRSIEAPRSVFRTIGRVRAAFVDALDRALAPFEVTAAQFFILVLIGAGEAESASQLCRSISYDPGAMTRMLDRLEQKGMIRRARHPADRRKTTLELTDDGRRVVPRLHEVASRVRSRFLRGFSRAELDSLETCLQRILANA